MYHGSEGDLRTQERVMISKLEDIREQIKRHQANGLVKAEQRSVKAEQQNQQQPVKVEHQQQPVKAEGAVPQQPQTQKNVSW